jgi:hypothetical protein
MEIAPSQPTDRREHVALVAVICAVLLLTLVPYIYGWATCPTGMRFLGLIGQNGGDQAFYLGWGPKQAESGHLLFEDKYNGHAERRLVFNPLWLAMGWAARLSGSSVLAVFHVERVLFSGALLLAAYRLISDFLPPLRWRLAALLLLALCSGFGALVVPFREWGSPRGIFAVPPETWTPDLWVVESNVFLTMLWEVVLPCATFLFFVALRSLYRLLFQNAGSALGTGLVTLLLASVYPYAAVSVYSILAALVALRAAEGASLLRGLREGAIVVAVSAPMVAYDAYLVLTDPRLTTGQAGYASPGPLRYLVGFGVLSLLAPVGAYLLSRARAPHRRFLFVWVAVTLVQIYVPRSLVPFQMQLILGVQLPLAILAARALAAGAESLRGTRLGRPLRVAAGAALVLLVCALSTFTSAYHLVNVFKSLHLRTLPEYIDAELARAIEWMAKNTDESAVVLSSPEVAPYIPVLAHNRMFTGNYEAPTAGFAEKLERIRWLMDADAPKSDAEIAGFFREHRIAYVLYDEGLRRLGGEAARRRLEAVPGIALVFENDAARLYQVSPQAEAVGDAPAATSSTASRTSRATASGGRS